MSQVSKYPIQKEVYNEILDTFLQTIANLVTKQEVLEFFNEFLTANEKIMFSKRLAAGLLIAEGYDYKEIRDLLKISTATISTFSSFYKYGIGYKRVIDKLKKDKEITEFLIVIAEKVSALGMFGGKGSGTWKNINKKLKQNKSKLLQ